ncbi:MAG: hypothetical protein Q9160_002135 [Pyrenula sp. 1 TL-2023]
MAMQYINYIKAKAHLSTANKSEAPVLSDEDEQFLKRITSDGETAPPLPKRPDVQDLPVTGETKGNDAQIALMDGAQYLTLPESPTEVEEKEKQLETIDTLAQQEQPAISPEKPSDTKEEKPAEQTTEKTKDKSKRPKWSWLRRDSQGSKRKKAKDATADDSKDAADSLKAGQDDAAGAETLEKEAKQEEEDMTVMLERLNLAAVNNRVFSISDETQELLQKFNVVFRDLVNGAPTAYDDLESLLKNGDRQLQSTYKHLPGFLQKLVKQLPGKMGQSFAPEVMAAAAEKAEKSGVNTENAAKAAGAAKKMGFKAPSLKDLVGKPGAVASVMRSVIQFLRARFPAFFGMNVLWSLALFIVLLVFWYCHKRGRDVRLERERELTEKEVAQLEKEWEDMEKEDISSTTAPEGASLDEVRAGIEEVRRAREAAAAAAVEDPAKSEGDANPNKNECEVLALRRLAAIRKWTTAVYVSGNALVILGGAQQLLQTIYLNDATELTTVTIDEHSGRIAVSGGGHVFAYRPQGKDEGVLKWTRSHNLEHNDKTSDVTSLSWGSLSELLAGGSQLVLWALYDSENARAVWRYTPSSDTKHASLSYDSTYIASVAKYDRLLKLWRRLSFDSDEVRFDTSYLPHPTTITQIHWRRPWHQDQNLEHLLYTFCADNVVRIWAATDPHGLSFLQQWAEIDMNQSIQPRYPLSGPRQTRRYGFIIDSRDFSMLAEKAVHTREDPTGDDHALEHLIEIAQRSPEICVVFDGQQHMSAWGIENAGCKVKTASSIFNIAHVEGLRIFFPSLNSSMHDYVQICAFPTTVSDSSMAILVHSFGGQIDWYDTDVKRLFDSVPNTRRVSLRNSWSGHSDPVIKVVRSFSGKAVLSRTDANHAIVWKQQPSNSQLTLKRQSTLTSSDDILRSCVLAEGDFVALLHQRSVLLWDTRGQQAQIVGSCNFQATGKPLCVLVLPASSAEKQYLYIATICSDMKGIAWEISLPTSTTSSAGLVNGVHPPIREFCKFDIAVSEEVSVVIPVDPAGSIPTISGFLDVFARDVAMSFSPEGILRMLSAKVDEENRSVDWVVTSTIETGIHKPVLASGSSTRKAAMVDQTRTGLSIWDTSENQLEFEETFFDAEIIQDLDWTSTPDLQSVLAVGFPHRIVLLTQLRYDYLNAGPAWAPIREIYIRNLTPHPIGDSCWLGNGSLVIGSGNQMFIYDQELDLRDPNIAELQVPYGRLLSKDMFSLVQRLNGTLPVFHPQFVTQCILSGKIDLVHKLLTTLHRKLKFITEGDEVGSFLELDLEDYYEETDDMSRSILKEMRFSYADFASDEESSETVDENVAAILTDNLAKIALPQLSSHEQFHLVDIVECIATVSKYSRSMDANAARYLLFFRQHMLRKSSAPSKRVTVGWREVIWAFHSGSQDILVDLVTRQFQGKLSWVQARESGMFLWLSDITALRTQLENVARNEYTSREERDPVDCSLYYLALRKKAVLQGLWRMATWNREQGSTSRLLANNFNDPRWKTAALKNAYALLGRRRFHYAAAFFILGDALHDAANVCVNQIGDIHLAVAITRSYEGDDGPVLRSLLEDHVLPTAVESGNRWMATWAFWMLGRRDKAVRSLISPIEDLLETTPTSPGGRNLSPSPIPIQAKSYLSNDPALVVLYHQLREKTLQTLRGASMIKPREEWDFLIRNAKLYSRMGCDLLALDLVRNWEFLKPAPPSIPHSRPPLPSPSLSKTSVDGKRPDPRLLLRRRSSLVVDDLPSPTAMGPGFSPSAAGFPSIAQSIDGRKEELTDDGEDRAKQAPKPKPPPTVFEEPDANSLLDSFGF